MMPRPRNPKEEERLRQLRLLQVAVKLRAERTGIRPPLPTTPRIAPGARLTPEDIARLLEGVPEGEYYQGGDFMAPIKPLTRPVVTPEMVRRLPGPVQPIGRAARELTSPVQIGLMAATAGLGPSVAAGLAGRGLAGRVAAGAVSPIVRGGFPARLAAEAALGTGAAAASMETARRIPETAPLPVRVGLPLAAGLVGGAGAVGATRALARGAPQAARAVTPTLKAMAREERGGARVPKKPATPTPLSQPPVRKPLAQIEMEARQEQLAALEASQTKADMELQIGRSAKAGDVIKAVGDEWVVEKVLVDPTGNVSYRVNGLPQPILDRQVRSVARPAPVAPTPLAAKRVVSSEKAPALVKGGTTRPPVAASPAPNPFMGYLRNPNPAQEAWLARPKGQRLKELGARGGYGRSVAEEKEYRSLQLEYMETGKTPAEIKAGRAQDRADAAQDAAEERELAALVDEEAGAESAVAKVAPEAAVPTGPARAPQPAGQPKIHDNQVAAVYQRNLAKLPPEIRADLDNITRIDVVASPPERPGSVTEPIRGTKKTRIFLDQDEADRWDDDLLHEMVVSYLVKHPEKVEGQSFTSFDTTARRIVAQLKRGGPVETPAAPPPTAKVAQARAAPPAAPAPLQKGAAAATRGIPPQAEVPGQVSVTQDRVAPAALRPPVAQAPPVQPAAAPTGPFWLPEPPRAAREYLAAARKGQGWVFRGKKGAFETVEEARQMVLKARDMGQNTVPRVTSYIQQAGDTVKEFGIDPQGVATRVGNPQNRSLAINDVLSNYTHYGLTPKQLEIAKRHGFVYKEALKLARSYGVQISELGGPDEFWQYIARRVKSKLNPLTGEYETPPGAIGGFKMGAKIGAQKERVFDEMAQGLDLGLLYENPDQVMMAHIQGIYRLIGNKQAENMIKPLTRQITEAAPLQFGERAVYEPALRSRAAAVEIANAIDKVFTPEQGWKPLRVLADISSALVGQVAALDVSAPFIQGLALLGHDLKQALKGRPSAIWAKSYGYMWQAVANPKSINKFREANAPLYKRFIEAGGMTGQSEFVSAVPLVQRGLGKIPVVGKLLREVYKQTWGRMGQAYSDFLEVGKLKFFEQMEPVWRRNGENIYELGAVTNRMAGAVSSAGRGVGVNQRLLERSLLFAPNYLRASMLLMRDLMSRGATAREAQASLAAFLGAGAAIYYGEEKVRGREPKMKPWPKRLGGDGAEAFTTEAGGARVGMGSWMYGMIKMLSEVGAVAVDDPDSLVVWDDRHPVVRFLKTKQGPAVGLAREMATGRNFFGRKFDSPDDYLMRIAESFIPIAGQSMITQKPRGGIAQGLADVAGLRSFPYSVRSRWTDEEPLFKAYSDIPANDREAQAKGFRLTRDKYLKANPKVDAMVYILGDRESLQKKKGGYGGLASDAVARGWVVRLMREYGLKAEDVPGLQEKEYESDDRKKLRLAITRALKAQEGQPAPQGRTQPQPTAAPRQPAASPGWQPGSKVPPWEVKAPVQTPAPATWVEGSKVPPWETRVPAGAR